MRPEYSNIVEFRLGQCYNRFMEAIVYRLLFKAFFFFLRIYIPIAAIYWALKILYYKQPYLLVLALSVAAAFPWVWKRWKRSKAPKTLVGFEVSTYSMSDRDRGFAFERFIRDLYIKSGRKVILPSELRAQGMDIKGFDQGLDLIVTDGVIKAGIQLKCHSHGKCAGNTAVQQIVTAKNIYKFDEAVVITNQTFSDAAKQAALANNVTLVDREELEKLIHNLQAA
jgi:hypothetical protein